MKLQDKIFNIIDPIIENLGIELVDVDYVKEGKEWYLRIFIDKEGSINLDDCQMVSEKIDPILDENNFIDKRYFLEVSSPGVERVLKRERDYKRYTGKLIELKTYKSINGKKLYKGILKDYNEEIVTLEIDNEDVKFNRKDIAIAKKIFEF